jgi:hypothetical protein
MVFGVARGRKRHGLATLDTVNNLSRRIRMLDAGSGDEGRDRPHGRTARCRHAGA